MKELLIELMAQMGLGRGSYVPSTKIYCVRLNKYTNDKFNFTPIAGNQNVVTFQVGNKVHLLKINYYPENVIESIEIQENAPIAC